MAKTRVVQNGNETLRLRAENVPLLDISGKEIKKIIQEMKEVLVQEKDGVAVAAPQIGKAVRIFVVSGKVFSGILSEDVHERRKNEKKKSEYPDRVFINPEITKVSKKKQWVPEGCLSVRWWYGETHRAFQATVRAYNEQGEKFTLGGSGLLAQIFQHEIDHLDGILFIDHAKNLHELTMEEREEYEKIMKKK